MQNVIRFSLRAFLGLITLVVVGSLLFAWRLEQNPLALDRFVPMAEKALTPGDGNAVRIGALALEREGGALALRMDDLRVIDADGALVVFLPLAKVRFSLPALLSEGVLAPEQAILEGLDLAITLREGEAPVIGVRATPAALTAATAATGNRAGQQNDSGEPAVSEDGTKAVTAPNESDDLMELDVGRLVAEWSGHPRFNHLRQIDLAYGNITVIEPARGLAWRAPNIAASVVRSDAGIAFRGSGRMRQQRVGGEEIDRPLGQIGWHLQVSAVDKGIVPDMALELTLDQVNPTILTGIVPPLVGERGLEAPVSGTVVASFPAGRLPESAAFALDLGEGRISLAIGSELLFDRVRLIGQVVLPEGPVKLDELILDYADARGSGQLRLTGEAAVGTDGDIAVDVSAEGIAPAWLASLSPDLGSLDGIEALFAGSAKLVFDGDGQLRQGSMRLTAGGSVIDLPDVFDAPVSVSGLEAKAALRRYGADWSLDGLELRLPDGSEIQVTGQANRNPEGGTAAFQIAGEGFLVETVKRFWPKPVSPPAREWVSANIKSGRIPALSATVNADIGAIGTPLTLSNFQVDARMPLRDIVLTYWDPLPGATGVNADARITEKLFEAEILSGVTDGMTVSGGHIAVSGIDKGKGHELLELEIDADGSAAALMGILDRPPLHFARFLDLAPAALGGAIAGRLKVVLPPIAELGLDDVQISAAGQSRNAVLPGIAAGYDLTDGDLSFNVDKQDLHVKGKAKFNGVPVSLSAHMPFDGADDYRARYVVIGRAGNRARAAFGLDGPAFQPPAMDGPAGVILTATQRLDGQTHLDLELDFSKAALSFPPVGWSKPKGSFAAGKARLRVAAGALTQVGSFQLSGPGMQLAGSARFPAGGGRAVVNLRTLKLGGGTDIRADLVPMAGGGYEVRLGKGRLDLRPMILANDPAAKPGKGSAAPGSGQPLKITLNGPSVRVRSGPPLEDMRGELVLDGDTIVRADLTGRPAGVGVAAFRFSTDGALHATADDAGALLLTLGIPGRLEGGALSLAGTASADWTAIDAKMTVTDFTLLEAPVMMRVLQLASITGPLELLAGSEGLPMTAMEAPFRLRDRKLTVPDGRVYGGSLGVTFRGDMDLRSQTMDFRGAVVPVYVLNSLLSAVPLVGDVLTGGEGVFAVTYSVSGPYADPRVDVNPLSLLAPGGLRRLLID